ncbi:MAG: iron-containing alcohol dehydrogenase [bacterium]|nr:iron-containing alcohol dehydrogenase [bacterium]
MNPFSFSDMGAVSFGTDRIQQLADDIFALYALCARPFKKPGLVRIMIPTTAGTGTEVTRTATFTNHAGHEVWKGRAYDNSRT